jgi:hypothetical protein
MNAITGNQVMIRERLVQVMSNLRGYVNHSHVRMTSKSSWIDQRNTLERLHVLEEKMFKRELEFFFGDHNGCYVLADELIESKVGDIESKVAIDR